jgi:hypothetical protein
MHRRSALFAPLAIAACAQPPAAPTGPDIAYAYLPRLRLDAADVVVESRASVPPGDLGALVTPTAVEAVQILGRDRLAAFGTAGTARFLVMRATISRESLPRESGWFAADPGERLVCQLGCRVEVTGADGTARGFAEASLRRTAPTAADQAARLRAAEGLLRRTAFDLNAEFEFQLRRAMRELLVEGERAAPPPPGGVQRESL